MLPYPHKLSQSLVPGKSLIFSSLYKAPRQHYCGYCRSHCQIDKDYNQTVGILSFFIQKWEAKIRCEQDGIGHFSNLPSPILDVPSAKYAASWVLACFVFAQSNIPRTIWDQSTRRILRSLSILVVTVTMNRFVRITCRTGKEQ